MKILIGSDHNGYHFKEILKELFESLNLECIDVGTTNANNCNAEDYAAKVAYLVKTSPVNKGILISATGMEMAIVANRTPDVRAVLCTNERMATKAINEIKANTLCLGTDITSRETAIKIVKAFLNI